MNVTLLQLLPVALRKPLQQDFTHMIVRTGRFISKVKRLRSPKGECFPQDPGLLPQMQRTYHTTLPLLHSFRSIPTMKQSRQMPKKSSTDIVEEQQIKKQAL